MAFTCVRTERGREGGQVVPHDTTDRLFRTRCDLPQALSLTNNTSDRGARARRLACRRRAVASPAEREELLLPHVGDGQELLLARVADRAREELVGRELVQRGVELAALPVERGVGRRRARVRAEQLRVLRAQRRDLTLERRVARAELLVLGLHRGDAREPLHAAARGRLAVLGAPPILDVADCADDRRDRRARARRHRRALGLGARAAPSLVAADCWPVEMCPRARAAAADAVASMKSSCVMPLPAAAQPPPGFAPCTSAAWRSSPTAHWRTSSSVSASSIDASTTGSPPSTPSTIAPAPAPAAAARWGLHSITGAPSRSRSRHPSRSSCSSGVSSRSIAILPGVFV